MTFFASHIPTPDGRYRSVRRITHPNVEPVSLSEAKAHLRVDSSTDDTYIASLIKVAREWCEEYLDRSLVYTQWQVKTDFFPVEFEVPRPPIATAGTFTAVTLTYDSTDGTTKTVASADYRVDRDSTPAVVRNIYNGTWPSDVVADANAVTLTFWAGFSSDAASVPQVVKHAMLMLIGSWYDGARSGVLVGTISKEVEFGVKSLLDSARWGLYR